MKTKIACCILVVLAFIATGCQPKAKLTITKVTLSPGESIAVAYTAPKGYKENAWVGIIPSDVEHGSESRNDQHDLTYQYLRGSTSGSLTFKAPSKPGKYDFRMHDTDSDGLEVASITFEVAREGAKAPEKTDETTAAAVFPKGSNVMVEWKGSWWPAKVIDVSEGKAPYKIHYDGYSSSWDEWVTNDRIKNR
jgi:hypothetical protein